MIKKKKHPKLEAVNQVQGRLHLHISTFQTWDSEVRRVGKA